MKVSIIGTGYVGLVTGVGLAEAGHQVICVDKREDIVSQINRAVATIFEEGLEALLNKAVAAGALQATTDLERSVVESEVTMICVGTPTGPDGMDTGQLESAVEAIGAALRNQKNFHVVVVKSTVLPGTTEGIVKEILEKRTGRALGDGWGLCMNPEFLREGRAVEDCMSPDRIVVGASDEQTADKILKLYGHFECPKIVTSPRVAEVIKYAANSLFATLISFSNEIANICTRLPGVDARDVWRGVHLDRRIATLNGRTPQIAGIAEYLWHGLGFGGSCFPKDVAALQHFGGQIGAQTPILDAVLNTNNAQPLRIVDLLEQEFDLQGKRIAVLGLAFKPGTDDVRESPALPVIKMLRRKGAAVVVHDPVVDATTIKAMTDEEVHGAQDWASAVRNADACCLVTSWPEYRAIEPEQLKNLMRFPLLIDGRGIFDAAQCDRAGVLWRGIGFSPRADRAVARAEI